MTELPKPSLQTTVVYRVKVPVRGVNQAQHKERLPQDESTRVPVRCYGRDYSVLEQELTQNCERVIARLVGPLG